MSTSQDPATGTAEKWVVPASERSMPIRQLTLTWLRKITKFITAKLLLVPIIILKIEKFVAVDKS
jgi:hypothetical protein